MATQLNTCYKHPDQPAGVICQRCDRPICPRCMHQASVGFHCPECAKGGAQKVYTGPAALAGTAPVVTKILIAANVAVFLLGFVLVFPGSSPGRILFDGSGRLLQDGGLYGPYVHSGEWWRLITAGFLHLGIIHIALNMYALWWLGSEIERAFGRLQLLAIYAVSLLAGSLGALIAEPRALTVGASGAIYGLLGTIVAVYRSRGIRVRDTPIFGVLLINAVFTIGWPNISIGGHIGGFLGGLLVGFVLFDLAPRHRLPPAVPWLICLGIGVVSFAAALLVAPV